MNLSNKYWRYYSKVAHGLMLMKNKQINRHVVVFESDDWGSVRMPSLNALNRLLKRGVRLVGPESYDRVDTLASNDDLEILMDVLSSVKDLNNNPAKITFNCCIANPDFDKIRESGFKEYHYELFTETLKKYNHHDRAFDLWKEGMRHKVFMPQFHGREHLNPQKWLRYLQAGDKDTVAAFDEGCFSVFVSKVNGSSSFLEAFGIESVKECDFVKKSIVEGLNLFEEIFGFRSESIISPCYVWDDYIEEIAAEYGVRFIQGSYIQSHSPWQRSKGKRISGHYNGERNSLGQYYSVRNCSFEPTQNSADNADHCMAAIKKAFECHLPAVVSCHRLNFIGDLDKSNRDNNLHEFGVLLKMIVKNYPDVEFLSSDELGKLIVEI